VYLAESARLALDAEVLNRTKEYKYLKKMQQGPNDMFAIILLRYRYKNRGYS